MRKFKSTILSLIVLFVLSFQTGAQDIRTLNTKVADILAQMPAKSNEHLNKILIQTVALGDEGITDMLQMLKPAGEGDDVAVRFTLTSLARYCSQKGHEKEWALVQQDFLKAINTSSNKEIQAYLIHQLNYGANDAAIDPLKVYLKDERLCEPVTQLYLNVKSLKSEQTLLEAFPAVQGSNQITLIKALGELHTKTALPLISKLEGSTNRELERTVLLAMAKIGDPQSYNILWDAATKASFDYDPTEATASFIKYTNQLGATNQPALCKQACLALIKANTDEKHLPNQAAALKIYAQYFKPEAMALLLKVVDSSDSSFRVAVLNIAKGLGDEAYVQKWIKKAKGSAAETKADIIYMLGERKDKSATAFVLQSLNDKSSKVRKSAIWALVKLDEQVATKELLSSLSKGNEQVETEKALNTLLNEKSLDQVALLLDNAGNTGKAGLIHLIAAKSGQRFFQKIYSYTANSDSIISGAAISALKNISSKTDVGALLQLLAKTEAPAPLAEIQWAIVKAVSEVSNPDSASVPVLNALQTSTQKEKIVPILSAIGGKQSLKAVAALYESSTGNLKQACFKGLVNWKNPASASYLYQICKENNATFRAEAFSGFVNQVQSPSLPDDQKLLKLQMIMPFAQSNEEKKKVIEALAGVNTFLALVYADKFMDEPELQQAAAYSAVQITLPASDSKGLFGDIPKAVLKRAVSILSGPESDYIKENVNKYIENMPQDAGFVSMFNGVDLTGWKGYVTDPIKKANLTAKELDKLQQKANEKLHNNWNAKDGMIVFNGEGDNLLSEKEYSDFEMVVNWKISKKGDSGIYLRGSPQVQIWDTTRVEVGAQVGSGGLYNNQVNPTKPLKVADNPIEEWNTFRITMIGEKVTVYLNGELVVDNVTLENYWDRAKPIFPTGTVELQAHGTDLAFKDIYIREIKTPEVKLSNEEAAQGFKSLFNGKNLDGWVGNTKGYSAVDGNIVIKLSNKEGEGGGNLYTEKEYSDFIFRFEFLLTPGANNGLGVRAPLEGDAAYVGMELQILDNTAAIYADLKPYQYHGSVYGVIPAKREFAKPLGEWNYEEVELKGSKIKITLNGTVIVDGDIKEASKNGTLDGKDHPGLLREKGHIGFLGHGSMVSFRNIRIKEL